MPKRPAKRGSKKRKSSSNDGVILGAAIGGSVVVFLSLVLFIMTRSMWQAPAILDNLQQAAADATSSLDSATTDNATASVASGSSTFSDANRETVANRTTASTLNDRTTTPSTSPTSSQVSLDHLDPEVREALELMKQVNAAQAGTATSSPSYNRGEELPLPELIELVEKSVVRIRVKAEFGGATGSGFVVDKAGGIITNYHVMEGATSAEVEFQNGSKLPVEGFFKADADVDLCLIKVFPDENLLHPIPLAKEIPRKGEKVLTSGAPLGLSFSSSEGIVSGIRDGKTVGYESGTFVQTTAPISSGNSGGPLTNMKGEVIGVNTVKFTEGESLNFAVSCMDVQKVIDQKGNVLYPISPETLPVKIAGLKTRATDLVDTERGKLLLSQIREAIIIAEPLNQDPSGRIMDYVSNVADRTFEEKLKWRSVRLLRDLKDSTAVVVVAIYFAADIDTRRDRLLHELTMHTVIIVRDVDKEGNESLAKVWDDKEVITTLSTTALVNGVVPRSMQSGVRDYFNKLVNTYKRAIREIEN